MSLFDTLLIAHLVGDWLLQSEWMALEKQRNWGAMIAHVAVYHALVLVVLLVGVHGRGVEVVAAVLLLALSHAWLDRGWPVVGLMRAMRIVRVREPERWLVMVIDQVLHVSLLALAAAWLGRAGAP